jgi:hypothetical protein
MMMVVIVVATVMVIGYDDGGDDVDNLLFTFSSSNCQYIQNLYEK